MIKKYKKDGKVAVLYSPEYGAGWSTQNSEYAEFLLFDKGLVKLVLNNQKDKIDEYIEGVYPDKYIYTGGAKNLKICWMEPETQFIINEYDGYESIEYDYNRSFYKA